MAKRNKQREIPEKLKDFRAFLYMVWLHLGLPEPTPLQYDIAHALQTGDRRLIIQAFRGAAKSYITSAFVIWNLLWDPDKKIMVVSAGSDRARDFSTFCFRIINEVPILQHLKPGPNDRSSNESFDVGPAKTDHSPSVKSIGITGQLTGSRSDLTIADDVEVPSNSRTEVMREHLSELVKEFDAVLKPGGRVIYLGTPQTEMSLYTSLAQRGYKTLIWPARYPSDDRVRKYQGDLGPYILRNLEDDPSLPEQCEGRGAPTEPSRFPDIDLLEREGSYGRSGFALQFMLDTSLSDAEKYPLKLSDLVVMGLDRTYAPVSLAWGSSPDLTYNDLPNQGLAGDRFYAPMFRSSEVAEYSGTVMAIDPSGRGKDETAYAVVRQLHGNLFLVESGGFRDGYSEGTLKALSAIAAKWDAGNIYIESNYGDGMFAQLLKPYLDEAGVVAATEEVRVSTAKEWRIADTLEPVMNQHRLVVDPQVIKKDFEDTQDDPSYSLFFQMTRLTREKGAIRHDDRLDALYMAVHWWISAMDQDQFEQAEAAYEEKLQDELDRFVEGVTGVPGRPKDTWVEVR